MDSNIFGNDKKKSQEFNQKFDSQSRIILNLVEKEKNFENSLDLINEKIELLDHNLIKNTKHVISDIKSIREDVMNLKHDISLIKSFNSKLTKQLKLMSSKDEVIRLEKYIDLWNPMDFVTREELLDTNSGLFLNDSNAILRKKDLKIIKKEIVTDIKKEIETIILNFLKKD